MKRSHTVQSSLSHGSKAHAVSTTIPGSGVYPATAGVMPCSYPSIPVPVIFLE